MDEKRANSYEKNFDEAMKSGDYELASSLLNMMYVECQLMITQKLSPDLKELTYFKAPVEVENGGVYLLAFTHVSGPKIQLQEKTDVKSPS